MVDLYGYTCISVLKLSFFLVGVGVNFGLGLNVGFEVFETFRVVIPATSFSGGKTGLSPKRAIIKDAPPISKNTN